MQSCLDWCDFLENSTPLSSVLTFSKNMIGSMLIFARYVISIIYTLVWWTVLLPFTLDQFFQAEEANLKISASFSLSLITVHAKKSFLWIQYPYHISWSSSVSKYRKENDLLFSTIHFVGISFTLIMWKRLFKRIKNRDKDIIMNSLTALM